MTYSLFLASSSITFALPCSILARRPSRSSRFLWLALAADILFRSILRLRFSTPVTSLSESRPVWFFSPAVASILSSSNWPESLAKREPHWVPMITIPSLEALGWQLRNGILTWVEILAASCTAATERLWRSIGASGHADISQRKARRAFDVVYVLKCVPSCFSVPVSGSWLSFRVRGAGITHCDMRYRIPKARMMSHKLCSEPPAKPFLCDIRDGTCIRSENALSHDSLSNNFSSGHKGSQLLSSDIWLH